MARASLARKSLSRNLFTTIYQVLDAKFSAETAASVGKSTTVLLQRGDGTFAFLSKEVISKARGIWERERQNLAPKDAIEEIEKSGAAMLMLDPNSGPIPSA
jgi:hypothetical protein